MYHFLPDRYDALTGTGMFVESHVKEDCLTELIRIVKPGMRIWVSCPSIAFSLSHRELKYYCCIFLLADVFNWLNLPEQIVAITWCCVLHYMMTSSNGNIPALLAICARNSPATGEFPSQRPVTRSFNVFFDLRLNKRLGEQSRRRWVETPPRSL